MISTFKAFEDNFSRFAELADTPIERIQVPYNHSEKYKGKTMRGYFFLASDDGQKRPTVIFLNGAETMAEDAYFITAAAGIERGYNVLTADLPGDMATRIYDPDFKLEDQGDAGLKSLVDYALTRPEVDPDKLIINGFSMGGYKAGRLAQIDKRVKAAVANAPMINAGKVLDAMKIYAKIPAKAAKDYARRFVWQYGLDPKAPA